MSNTPKTQAIKPVIAITKITMGKVKGQVPKMQNPPPPPPSKKQ